MTVRDSTTKSRETTTRLLSRASWRRWSAPMPSSNDTGRPWWGREPAYFYANPWPFDADKLVKQTLPGGARWHQEGWQGTMLPYADVVGDPEAEDRKSVV